MKAVRIFLITGFILSAVSSNYAQIKDDLHQTILEVHEKQQNVGLAAVIFRGGDIFFSDYLGFADIEHQVPVSNQTKFGVASITKLFTAVTLLKLHGDGKIDLDAPVQKYIPEFPRKSDKDITIRMLATHQSGIPHPQKRTPTLFATHYERAVKAIEVFIDDTLLFEPGSQTKYSSSNYNLLAAVVERVTGKLFTEVVKEMIFIPLNLINTSFDNVMRPISNRARRYSFYHPWTYAESDTLYRVPTWDYSFNMGGGNIISTANDIAKFGSALWKSDFLPEEQLRLLYTKPWFGEPYKDGMFIYVTGSNPGVQAGLTIYPEEKIVTVVLSNTWGKGSRSAEMVKLASVLSLKCLADNQPKN